MTSQTSKAKVEKFASTVIIVGAGPVGLLTALYLAQAGIHVDLLEKEQSTSDAPRAVGYYGGALLALKRVGVLGKMQRAGFTSQGLCWRKPIADDGKGSKRMGDIIALLRMPKDDSTLDGLQTTIYLRQSELSKLLLREVLETGLVRVHLGAELIAIDNQEDSVIASVRRTNGTMCNFHGLFLVGADSGKSTTRKILGIPFRGHSWPERIVAMDIHFEDKALNHEFPTSLIVDPIHFGLITPLESPIEGQMTLYRCSVAVDPNDPRSDAELTSDSSVASFLQIMLPGPRPLCYKSTGSSAYRIHQLCAATLRRRRCVLAGDAAHLNNPFGAMGLNTGLLDSEAVADALEMILLGKKPLAVLDMYSDARRKVFNTFVDPVSTQNKLRIANDPEIASMDWFLRSLQNPSQATLEEYGKPFFSVWRTQMQEIIQEHALA